jgi:hypothetical protein
MSQTRDAGSTRMPQESCSFGNLPLLAGGGAKIPEVERRNNLDLSRRRPHVCGFFYCLVAPLWLIMIGDQDFGGGPDSTGRAPSRGDPTRALLMRVRPPSDRLPLPLAWC